MIYHACQDVEKFPGTLWHLGAPLSLKKYFCYMFNSKTKLGLLGQLLTYCATIFSTNVQKILNKYTHLFLMYSVLCLVILCRIYATKQGPPKQATQTRAIKNSATFLACATMGYLQNFLETASSLLRALHEWFSGPCCGSQQTLLDTQ